MEKVGEVIAVESSFVIAEGKMDMLPPLGSLVETQGSTIYHFLVTKLLTESRNPGRTPMAYGRPLDLLKQEQPQVFELMKWSFYAVPVGEKNKKTKFLLPENLPEIHSLLYPVPDEELKEISKDISFIDTLFCIDKNKIPERDDAIMYLIQKYISLLDENEREDILLDIANRIAFLLRDDYITLKRFIDILGEHNK